MANVSEFRAALGPAMPVQFAWAILAAAWNAGGVWLISQGQRALGPTASIGAAVMLLAMAAAFVLSVTRWPLTYLLLSIVAGAFGLLAVVNALSADPALWPSEFWRYAGAVLNGVGFVGCAAAVMAYFRWRRGH
jgi:hypothetical protein